MGTWDEPDLSCLPGLPPTSPPPPTPLHGAASSQPGGMASSPVATGGEATEIVVEYTTSKGLKEKVRHLYCKTGNFAVGQNWGKNVFNGFLF